MAAIRKAEVIWEGDLIKGAGQIVQSSSGVIKQQPVTWASRTEAPGGKTSPEELLAAAHASCFAMALSFDLANGKTPPRKLEVSATVTFDKVGEGFKVVSSALEVKGSVPGLDAQGFQKAAEGAKQNCPISKALQGNVELSVKASLV